MIRKNLLLASLIFGLMGFSSLASDQSMTGKWEIVIHSGHGEFVRVMTFEQDGEELKVSCEDLEGEGQIKNDEIEWAITLLTPMGDLDAEFRGRVEGNEMAGEVIFSSMEMDWNASKIE